MSTPPAHVVGVKEGMEARKQGKPRVSPYAGIKALSAFHKAWLKGWDAGREDSK